MFSYLEPNIIFEMIFDVGQEWADIRKFSMEALKDFGVGKKSVEERIHEEVQFLSDVVRMRTTRFWNYPH
jgi:hypothetical protein